MGTLFDYLDRYGETSFSQSPLNEVDSLIFSLISYVDPEELVPAAYEADGISLREAANAFFAKYPDPSKIYLGLILPYKFVLLLRAAKDTRRFGEVLVKGYRNVIDVAREMQFSAFTFVLPNDSALIAYRGTDDTLIGWKEDLNMAILPVIPAQEEAAAYLNAIAPRLPRDLYLTGHSKGANLAAWAAFNCEPSVRAHLKQVHSFDGPGFATGTLRSPDYTAIRPIIQYFVPQGTVFGLLLEHDESYQVVHSTQKGLHQHDGVSWQVEDTSLVRLETVTAGAKQINLAFHDWLSKTPREECERLIASLFRLLAVKQATTLTETAKQVRKIFPFLRLFLTDREARRTARKLLTLLLRLRRQGRRAERKAKFNS